MWQPLLNCASCNQGINMDEKEFLGERDGPAPARPYRRAWHFQCVPEEGIISGQINPDPAQLGRWNTWRISKLAQANTALEHQSETLAAEVKRLMIHAGASQQEISAFFKKFALHDDILQDSLYPPPVTGTAP